MPDPPEVEMTEELPPRPSTSADPPPAVARFTVNEDWAATILGLVLLTLVLIGVIPTGLVP